MGIGASIALIAIGAILAFAVDFDVAGLDIRVIGYILMIVGAIGAVLTLVVWGPRRRDTVVRETPVRDREVVRERDRDPYDR